jgi:quinol monooxygenase YgiN
MSHPLPPAAILVAHKVADYDLWKAAFDDDAAARKEAGFLGHDVNRGLDDREMVYLYCPLEDYEKARAFVESPHVDGVMKAAGVVGPPMIKFMKPVSVDYVEDPELVAMIVVHGVENYDAWRAVYDEIDAFRKKSGIVGHAVNHEWGTPNRVVILHQAKDRATLQRFVDSAELKDAMRRGGVSGSPEFHYVQVCDYAEY